MCIFTLKDPQNALEVGGTHIFARMDAAGWQWSAYEMSLRSPEPVAMVLPVPTAAPADDCFEFIDLSAYPALFDDLTRAIRVWTGRSFQIKLSSGARSSSSVPLPVHAVGAYEASFVPDRAAFSRLDERFRLSPEIWERLPDYRGHSFAVFKFAPTNAQRTDRVHAMAFRFRAADPNVLFFPTVHVHGDGWKDEASFDHTLYLQVPGFAPRDDRFFIDGRETTHNAIWDDSESLIEAHRSERADGRMRGRFGCIKAAGHGVSGGGAPLVDPARSCGVVDAGTPIFAMGLSGRLPNADTVIQVAAGGVSTPLRIAGAEARPDLREASNSVDDLDIV